MKITVLTDNHAGSGFLAEHGLSFLVESNGEKILFDTGATDVFMQNARRLNINIDKVKTIVLSHGHWDHGNGLVYLKNKKLITHPNTFIKRYRKSNNKKLGLNQTFEQINSKFDVQLSSKPLKISENVFYLGEIERKFDFEQWQTPYVDEFGQADFITDDSALAIIENQELNIVTGCSHSGICNIIEQAKKVSGIEKINTVIGGFHLKQANTQTTKTIQYLKAQNIKNIFPSHCTQLPALVKFYEEMKVQQIKTGSVYIF